MKAGGGLIGLLVLAAAIFLPRLLGGGGQGALGTGTAAGATEDQVGPVQCVSELEQILCGASDDVQDFWIADYPTAFGGSTRRRTPRSSRARSTPAAGRPRAQVGPFYCPADGFVYFDLDFLTQLQNQFGAEGDLAAQYIVAHEYGHHVQNLLGISDDVNRRSQQDPGRANQYSIALELQADCFAGAWARNADDAVAARGRRPAGGAGRRRGRRRRPHPAADPGARQPRIVDPRLGRAARVLVPPRLRHRRPRPLHHVPRSPLSSASLPTLGSAVTPKSGKNDLRWGQPPRKR